MNARMLPRIGVLLSAAACAPATPAESPHEPIGVSSPPPGGEVSGEPAAPAPDDTELHGPEPGAEAEPPGEEPEPPAQAPPRVEVDEPKLTTGEIPKLEANLKGMGEAIAKCVSDHGGMEAETGSVKLQFLVQGAGRAEGVDVLEHAGVSKDAAQCVKRYVHKRLVGTPSVEPIGVTVALRFTRQP